MPEPTIKIAILGYGFSGSVFHASLIAATPGLEVAAIVEGRPEVATKARQRFPGAQVFSTVEEVFARADQYDAVVVALPNDQHVPLGLRAVAAGVPVIVDKPLASSVGEAERLVSAAAAAGVPALVFQNRRWDSEILTVRKLLELQDIGDVLWYESSYKFFRPEVEEGWREKLPQGQAPGMLFDLGAHIVDQAVQLFGPVDSVYGEVGILRPGALVPDDFFLAIRHTNGVTGHLRGSVVISAELPRFTVQGTRGSIQVADQDPQEDQLIAGLMPGSAGFGVMGRPYAVCVDASGTTTRIPAVEGAQHEFYRLLNPALRGEGPLPVDIEHSLYALRVLEAGWKSSRERTVVALDAPAPADLGRSDGS
ncbi:MAG: Gfo/Idh/MocA family oxidoreductase [Bifidobacteriaceae bacterium]|jgi:predicted dehydrogenase|nr:Gfo/Idh/MocA family oxidoreductase [Bifidobacteriaceae bacterium]